MRRLVLMALLAWPLAGVAEPPVSFYNGNELQEICVGTGRGEGNAEPHKYNRCVTFLAAVAETAGAFQEAGMCLKVRGPCLPDGVAQEQLRQVWLKWARENPEDLHYVAASNVLVAFNKAWPCGR